MRWLRNLVERLRPRRRLIVIEGDSLPPQLPPRDLVVAREDEDDWVAGMRCPCGCGDALEVMLIPEVRPRWKLAVDNRGYPSLHPSVWRKVGCKSHFWLRRGRVIWC